MKNEYSMKIKLKSLFRNRNGGTLIQSDTLELVNEYEYLGSEMTEE